jgi:hypothetical protein
MPNDRFRIRVGVMRILEDHSLFEQVAKATLAHSIDESLREIAPQLIHGDLQNQFRGLRLRSTHVRAAK